MAKKSKSAKNAKHVPLSVLRRRYARNEKKNSALGTLIERRAANPTDPNDRR